MWAWGIGFWEVRLPLTFPILPLTHYSARPAQWCPPMGEQSLSRARKIQSPSRFWPLVGSLQLQSLAVGQSLGEKAKGWSQSTRPLWWVQRVSTEAEALLSPPPPTPSKEQHESTAHMEVLKCETWSTLLGCTWHPLEPCFTFVRMLKSENTAWLALTGNSPCPRWCFPGVVSHERVLFPDCHH